MKNKWVLNGLWLALSCLLILPMSAAGKEKKVHMVGREVLNFTLPSTQDRTINYADEYYGKHHLIVTFFPAAFTPV